MATEMALFLLSAGTLLFELVLTRLFSVSQFYHFAFVAVSLALLGFGASGSLLTLFPRWIGDRTETKIFRLSMGFGFSVMGSMLMINYIPFDSYAVAWDRRQLVYISTYLFALAIPFVFSGLAIGLLLANRPEQTNRTYAVNLIGSGAGCLLLPLALPILGGEGTFLFAAWLGILASFIVLLPKLRPQRRTHEYSRLIDASTLNSLLSMGLLIGLSIWTAKPPTFLKLELSPHKGLYQSLLNPEARLIKTDWNAFSRVDLVSSPSVRSLPGLSYAFTGQFPNQAGISVDGEAPMPVTEYRGDDSFAGALPEAIAYQLRGNAKVLVLTPGGGLAAVTAISNHANHVTIVENNPLLVHAVRDEFYHLGDIYGDDRVTMMNAGPRSYCRQTKEVFDVVQVSLIDSFRPVRSGAFSLGENYLYTVEGLEDFIGRLNSDGILVISRWLQNPPSEIIRLGATVLEALALSVPDAPSLHLVALRSFQTGTLLIKRSPWTGPEIVALRDFCRKWRFDLVYYPGMAEQEANIYTRLPEPVYYQTFRELVQSTDRRIIYYESTYEISPPTDNKPFFFHFFKWKQAPQLVQELGKSWQPFGGAGYFVLIILLFLALIGALFFILLPLVLQRRGPFTRSPDRRLFPIVCYFGLLGLGFLFVEIPLIQQFILFLDHPTFSMILVLFTVLLFSGLGSLVARRFRSPFILGVLAAAVAAYHPLTSMIMQNALRWSFGARLALTVPVLAPLCFLMGIPFARGLAELEHLPDAHMLIPWAWAINGCTSVVASVISAILTLSLGFRFVVGVSAGAYALAWLVLMRGFRQPSIHASAGQSERPKFP